MHGWMDREKARSQFPGHSELWALDLRSPILIGIGPLKDIFIHSEGEA